MDGAFGAREGVSAGQALQAAALMAADYLDELIKSPEFNAKYPEMAMFTGGNQTYEVAHILRQAAEGVK